MAGIFVIIFLAAVVGIFKPYISGLKRGHFAAGAAVSFVLIALTAPPPPPGQPSSGARNGQPASDPSAATETSSTKASPSQPESRWQYSEQRDEMRGTTSHHASVDSDNTVDLSFPYGTVRGTIWIRRRPEDGLNVAFQVERGQVLCHSFTNSYVSIRFDDGPIQRFRCVDSSDGSSETAFLTDSRRALAALKRSHRAVVEAEFFQQGRQQFVFQTAGLRWE